MSAVYGMAAYAVEEHPNEMAQGSIMVYIAYTVTLASIVGTVANSFGKRWCFWVWMCTNAFWCVYNTVISQYAQTLLYAFNFVLAIVGLVKWKRNRYANEKQDRQKYTYNYSRNMKKRLIGIRITISWIVIASIFLLIGFGIGIVALKNNCF